MTDNGSVLAAWQAEYKPKKVPVDDIILDGDLALELEEARAELARVGDVPEGEKMFGDSAKSQKRVDELQAEAEKKRHSLVVQSIGRKAWRDLLSDHPPTDDQKKQNQGLEFNPETFPLAALAACCCEIDGKAQEMDPEFAEWLLETISVEDATRIFTACLDANVIGVRVPKAATAARRRSAKTSTRR